jgi:hypothetical protein
LTIGKMKANAGAAENREFQLETDSIGMVELDTGKVNND